MIDPIAIAIGPLKIHWYGIIMGLAFFLGTYLARYNSKRSGIDPDHVLNMVVLIIPAAIVCARLYYVTFEWQQYKDNPLDIFAVWQGGLAIHGGLIGGVLAGAWYIRKHKLPFLRLADIFMPSVILGQAIGRWGNFINQEAHGDAVSAEFMEKFPAFIREQMFIGGQYYHPTFLYESIWNLIVFGILMLMLYRFKKFDGQVLFSYMILYSIGRFFIEGMRTDSLLIADTLRVAQLVSLCLIAAGVILMLVFARKSKQAGHSQNSIE
ncbi:prolipoprotein diacylglyceryl transferase [Brevibacillus formosus]|uniref:Phosphatidylglycerol--prolipoprotein diacylglyceryl transferase n=1 Tax=Brevibacillus formosus TaxID=54913 RepID=A0A837KWG8_9BACL|nr:prolipoprotein diacylglyceryl transferase [Brevibacillus formosus]KLI00850.1 diacylglyceryl transferase [Brevibacillus formosus]MED1956157.1 prolipoprotein diacylglyceryl transferase [Brevibacillus formosus]PSK00472.1 prolipoprotein diacylglyceryl transferase [Brevibacillus formosus]GED58269.1 prolipoprotein diacylglyceryl transferase [Brevibacillus formosus]